MAALGVSGYKTGIYVGIPGGEILGCASSGDIPIIDPEVTDIVFNLERASMPEIKIPKDELIKADVVFQAIGISRY